MIMGLVFWIKKFGYVHAESRLSKRHSTTKVALSPKKVNSRQLKNPLAILNKRVFADFLQTAANYLAYNSFTLSQLITLKNAEI